MNQSAAERVKASYLLRQKERSLDIEIWGGDLILKCNLVDAKGAQGAFRVLASIADDGTSPDVTGLSLNDMADVLADAVSGLYVPNPEKENGKERLVNENGVPILLDASFGEFIGVEEITTAREAVFTAFTEGDPPTINAFALMTTVAELAQWLMDPSASPEAAVAAKGR